MDSPGPEKKSIRDKVKHVGGRVYAVFPELNREERRDLWERLEEGSKWTLNFGMMLGCSVLIAGLGLLQDSVAVIIGAMLVAPLMTPLIGTGLALIQGNKKLFGESQHAMWKGTILSLVLGILLQVLTPGQELTMQVSMRGSPNVLDLLIAFFAGVAAGYAMVQPKLSGALPGVAISVALVPPLAASGIAMGSRDWLVAFGAFVLFFTNMVAIIVGSALVFRLHGLAPANECMSWNAVKRRILMGLTAVMVLLMAPLGWRLIDQVKSGQAKPSSLTVSEEVWYELHNRLDEVDGIDFLNAVRASSERPEDVTVVLLARRAVPQSLIDELNEMIDEGMGEDVKVKVAVVVQGTVKREEEKMAKPEGQK